MKKLLGITLLGVIGFSFSGCEKDEIEMQQPTENYETEQRILNFKDEIAKKDRNGESMHIDSLIWYTEAAMNYSYCHPGLTYEFKQRDSVLITVDLIDGCSVSPENVEATYIEVNNYLVEQYEGFKHEPKRLIVVNLELEGSNQSSAGIWVYSTIGKVYEEENLKSSNPFQSYDWWLAIGSGRCNGYNSTHPSTENAMDQLERYYITHNDAFDYLNPDYYNYYFTDVSGFYHFYGYNADSDWDLYMWDDSNYDLCISPTLMNYFLQHIDEVIIDDLPVGGKPFNLQIYPESIPSGRGTNLHEYRVQAGTYHGRAIPALMRPERL